MSDRSSIDRPRRHGCLTVWLVILVASRLFFLLSTVGTYPDLQKQVPGATPVLIGLLYLCAIAEIIFAIAIFRWRRWGFYGFAASTIVALCLNLVMGIQLWNDLPGLAAVVVLFILLQLGKENRAWKHLR
jgi:hypothetical protein